MTTALVLGGARCVWRDAARALDLFTPDYVVAAKDIGAEWPGHIDLWVSLHPEKFHKIQQQRERAGFNTDYVAVTHLSAHRNYACRIDVRYPHVWPEMTRSPNSGGFGVILALDVLKATRVVLAGIPMDAEAGHFNRPRPVWEHRDMFMQGWLDGLPRMTGRVRSMSGWTRTALGEPTADWLRSGR